MVLDKNDVFRSTANDAVCINQQFVPQLRLVCGMIEPSIKKHLWVYFAHQLSERRINIRGCSRDSQELAKLCRRNNRTTKGKTD